MAKAPRKWQRRTLGQWKALLERQAASGQSIEAFCREESITTASFYRWRKQLSPTTQAREENSKRSLPAPAFVDLGALGGGSGWELELALGDGEELVRQRYAIRKSLHCWEGEIFFSRNNDVDMYGVTFYLKAFPGTKLTFEEEVSDGGEDDLE